MSRQIYTAPPNSGTAVRGKTLPDILYDACDRYANPTMMNQPVDGGWDTLSLDDFRRQSEELALGLHELGLEQGDHVALFMESDVHFCLADMGCLIGGLIDVPIYLSHNPEQIEYVINHSDSKALVVANYEQLERVAPLLPDLENVRAVIVADPDPSADPPGVPDNTTLLSMNEVRAKGREATSNQAQAIEELRSTIQPDDLATIIYTSGTTGLPKGVMLTHENISYDALTSFSGFTNYEPGPDGETILSFLPLTHIFARALQYGYLSRGSSIYFTHPDNLVDVLPDVQPTMFASVPRLLEKVYAGIQDKIMKMTGFKKTLGTWSLNLARAYDLETRPSLGYRIKQTVADRLVFSKWRQALGGRLKFAVVGGAALSPELTNLFAAAGINLLQGYGLTETSPVITYNRPDRNKPGTTGEPIPGVEVTIADDGEILTRGPHVMKGYYKRQDKTNEVIDDEGWFHTGDIGEMTDDGFLKITDRKKSLFKLSTGKYVIPQPIENKLGTEALVEQAVVIGERQKFCAALIFPAEDNLRSRAANLGIDAEAMPLDELIKQPEVVELFQEMVDNANEGMDHWSQVKRFALVAEELTIESGLLTPTMKVKRPKIRDRFSEEIETLYQDAENGRRDKERSVIVS